MSRRRSPLAAQTPNGVEDELKRLHDAVARSAGRAAIAAPTSLVPTSRILLGGEDPFVPVGATAGGQPGVGRSETRLQAIRRDDAMALFPRLTA